MSGRQRPDILLLIVDDLRADLGAYGCRLARTPHMDALAARSATFLQAHASLANCAPSRATLLTGLRPNTHGVLDLYTHVRDKHPNVVTLPQRFRQAGYLAVAYGKIFHQFLDDAESWTSQSGFKDGHTYRGLRGKAWSRAGGWSHGWAYNEYMTPANRALQAQTARRRRAGDYRVGINRVMPRFEIGPDEVRLARTNNTNGAAGVSAGIDANRRQATYREYTDVRIARYGIHALQRLRAQPQPWLLALGFIRPHLPFIAPAKFWQRAHIEEGDGAQTTHTMISGASRLTRAHMASGDGELYDFAGPTHVTAISAHGKALMQGYAAAVSFVDAQVGAVLEQLRALGGENHTITVLCSDHGFKLGEYGHHWGKHTLMSSDTHVPLMIAAPGFKRKRVHAPVELLDVFPTLCHLIGLRATGSPCLLRGPEALALEGRSLVPLMRRQNSRRAIAKSAAFSQWLLHKPIRCMGYAIRTQGWLLIQWTGVHGNGTDLATVRACEAHTDLFHIGRNESRKGLLRETLVEDGHNPAVRRSLRRRIQQVMKLCLVLRASRSMDMTRPAACESES
jgi:iduronate 2-sulfatase